MAHVPLDYDPKGMIPKAARIYTERRFGKMVEPTAAAAHHSGVLVAMGSLETAVQRGWRKLDPTLRWLAIQATSTRIGCSWCIDYGYYEGMHDGDRPGEGARRGPVAHQRSLRRPGACGARVRGGRNRLSG